jgi:hypothetical protein
MAQAGPQGTGTSDTDLAWGRRIGVGCFTTFAGFASGGMVGVFAGKVVGNVRGCIPPEGLPACDWYYFALAGMILGGITLPVLALRRLRRSDAARPKT